MHHHAWHHIFLTKLWERKKGSDVHYLEPQPFFSEERLSRLMDPDLKKNNCRKKKSMSETNRNLKTHWVLDNLNKLDRILL
jgi:hypothetical protein